MEKSGSALKVAVIMGATVVLREAEQSSRNPAVTFVESWRISEAAVSKIVAIEAGTLLTLQPFSPGRVIIDGLPLPKQAQPKLSNSAAADTIDASQFIVAPGFIDPHIHGCGGGRDGGQLGIPQRDQPHRRPARHDRVSTTVSAPQKY